MSKRLKSKKKSQKTKAPTYKNYRPEDLQKAVKNIWDATTRLRQESNGQWSEKMWALTKIEANKRGVPAHTVRYQIVKRMKSPDTKAAVQKKADARSKLTQLEKKILFVMRKRRTPPTRDELRAQAMDILEARGVTDFLSNMWVTRYKTYCTNHLTKDDLGLVERVPRSLGHDRTGVTPEQIARYFHKLKTLVEVKKFQSNHFW